MRCDPAQPAPAPPAHDNRAARSTGQRIHRHVSLPQPAQQAALVHWVGLISSCSTSYLQLRPGGGRCASCVHCSGGSRHQLARKGTGEYSKSCPLQHATACISAVSCRSPSWGLSACTALSFPPSADPLQPRLARAGQPSCSRGTSHVQCGVSSVHRVLISPYRGDPDQVSALCCDVGRPLQVSIPLQVTLAT